MHCPNCGQEARGVTCPRCQSTLPRSRGATVVMEDENASLAAPAQPAAYMPLPAQADPGQPGYPQPGYPQPVIGAPGTLVDPLAQTGYAGGGQASAPGPGAAAQPVPDATGSTPSAWSPAPPDSRRGLVWRGVFGGISLMLGTPAILFAILFTVAIIATQREIRADLLTITAGVLLIGILEVVAGARVLKGAPSPHALYLFSLAIQFLAFLTMAILVLVQLKTDEADTIFAVALIFAIPLLPPLLRLIPLLMRSSGKVLGSREGGGVPMRPVPFVLWAPTVTFFASPVYAIVLLGVALLTIKSLGALREYEMAALLAGAEFFTFILFAGLFGGSLGMMKRARWSIAVGGAAGAIGALVSLGAFAAFLLDISGGRFSDDDISRGGVISFATTALLVPSVSLLAGAIKFGFRLPAYLDEATGAPRRKLMQILVPQSDA